METTTIKVDGMTCGGCSSSVTRALRALPGVTKVEMTLDPGQAVVDFDPLQVTRAVLCAAIDDAGFEAA